MKTYLIALSVLAVVCFALPAMVSAQTATDIAIDNVGELTRPMAAGQTVPDANYVHVILWTDAAGLSGESYNIYTSNAPITDVDAAFVFRVGTEIPEGQQAYEHALNTPYRDMDGTAVTAYYAVTVVKDGVEDKTIVPDVNATTEGEDGVLGFQQPLFWFVDPPVIDGYFTDWPFDPVVLDPTMPGRYWKGTIDGPSDISGKMAMGVDIDNVYFRGEITDDLLLNENEDASGDLWKGDCLEWYWGPYDLRPSEPRHETTMFGNETDPALAENDWQQNIAGNAGNNYLRGQLYSAGQATTGGDLELPGMIVQTVETDVGWNIEAKVPFTEYIQDPSLVALFVPKIGMILPSNFAINDGDTPGAGREAQLFWASDAAADNSWNTPSAWEHVQVIYDPKVFGLAMPPTAVESATWGEIKSKFAE